MLQTNVINITLAQLYNGMIKNDQVMNGPNEFT